MHAIRERPAACNLLKLRDATSVGHACSHVCKTFSEKRVDLHCCVDLSWFVARPAQRLLNLHFFDRVSYALVLYASLCYAGFVVSNGKKSI